jgi:DNA-binding transcriptional MerR regulator
MIMAPDAPMYGPEELAEQAGVSRRTVRYYVQRGLLPAPAGLGRGKHYSEAHLQRLLRIRALQEAGVPLERIAEQLEGGAPPAIPTPRPVLPDPSRQSAWTRAVLGEGVELHLRGRRLGDEQLRLLATFIMQTIGDEQP